jgi:ferredoxin
MKNLQVYRELQRHLDKQPVGYPADRSGSDLRLLIHHFSEDEARVALGMTYRYETTESIYDRIKDYGFSMEQLNEMLDSMSSRLSIMQRESDGVLYYCLLPLVVGMYEGKVFNMDPEYVKAYNDYAHSMQHGFSFISTEVFQMRTIPIEKSIETKHHVLPYDNITEIIESAEDPFFIIECTCRKRKAILNEPCTQTARRETCMVLGDLAKLMMKYSHGRRIDKDEALNILRKSQEEGLVLQTYNMQKPEVICACCRCCCEILSIHKMLVNPVNFWTTNFHAVTDNEKCVGCRLCMKKCSVDAISFDKKKKKVLIRRDRCIGCGNCVPVCRAEALKLERNKETAVPPVDFMDMQETIMQHKPKWRLGRVIKRTLRGK